MTIFNTAQSISSGGGSVLPGRIAACKYQGYIEQGSRVRCTFQPVKSGVPPENTQPSEFRYSRGTENRLFLGYSSSPYMRVFDINPDLTLSAVTLSAPSYGALQFLDVSPDGQYCVTSSATSPYIRCSKYVAGAMVDYPIVATQGVVGNIRPSTTEGANLLNFGKNGSHFLSAVNASNTIIARNTGTQFEFASNATHIPCVIRVISRDKRYIAGHTFTYVASNRYTVTIKVYELTDEVNVVYTEVCNKNLANYSPTQTPKVMLFDYDNNLYILDIYGNDMWVKLDPYSWNEVAGTRYDDLSIVPDTSVSQNGFIVPYNTQSEGTTTSSSNQKFPLLGKMNPSVFIERRGMPANSLLTNTTQTSIAIGSICAGNKLFQFMNNPQSWQVYDLTQMSAEPHYGSLHQSIVNQRTLAPQTLETTQALGIALETGNHEEVHNVQLLWE